MPKSEEVDRLEEARSAVFSPIEQTPEDPADRRVFVLDEESWDAFLEMLETPLPYDHKLAELLAQPWPHNSDPLDRI